MKRMKVFTMKLNIAKIFLILFCSITLLPGEKMLDRDTGQSDPLDIHDPGIQDTLKPRYGNFIEDQTRNPIDLKDPSIIEQKVEYDPETGMYIITEKIGDDYFTMPSYMTMQEYLDWKSKQQEKKYFDRLAGVKKGSDVLDNKVDPASFVKVKQDLIERLFGGNEITIKPQGSIDLTFGGDYQKNLNPAYTLRQQETYGFDFDMNIKMNVVGSIGDKLKLDFNYDPKATFDFDNQIKLKYDSEEFNQDAIVKKIEAGNVSLPLRGSLIQGGQSLFGIKTELQFGHLRITAIASQQKSKQKGLTIDKGSVRQEYEIRPDEYDENRHFFLSHFNKDAFEGALEELPQVKSPFRISRIDVYVTNDRNETHDLRNICAIDMLGEHDIKNYSNPNPVFGPEPNPGPEFYDHTGKYVLADNRMSTVYEALARDEDTREQINTATNLQTIYGLQPTRDFEILKARKLNPTEYSYHPELGFISLNIRLRPDQVLGVAYEYTYTYNGDELYTVGEFNERSDSTNKVLYVKMLKSKNQRVNLPSWRLMMKNVYSIGAPDVNPEDFKLDIFFEDLDGTLKRFIPEESIKKIPLLTLFNLDNLSSSNDPQPDGIFDYVPGLTIVPKTGSVIFPVLEPFGNSLDSLLTKNGILAEKYTFNELYDTTITAARSFLEKNRFVLKGEYKSSVSSEISLGSWNIPRGSVTVTAGGRKLIEGSDYDIDYGTGRLRILNKSLLDSGRSVNVSFEDNSLYSFTQRNMLGLRADYAISPNMNIGATYMRLFERPFTEKVNMGDDPINNRIFGLDYNYSQEVDWLTRALDKLPFYSTKTPSKISFTTELAALKPGHSKAINGGQEGNGVVSIDDFEGTATPIYLDIETEWTLASTPLRFKGHNLTNDLAYGANRALLNWYIFDRSTRSDADQKDSYTRLVDQTELFDRDIQTGYLTDLRTFDFSYYPMERGPYNFDLPNSGYPGISKGLYYNDETQKLALSDPKSRWGGAMRYIDNNDFEALNIEYLEFWMLNPYMDRRNEEENPDINESGQLVFNLGNVSEDILKDNVQFYENSLPRVGESVPIIKTAWGKVPTSSPLTDALDPNDENRALQDVGLDGLTDDEEKEHFDEWLTNIYSAFPNASLGIAEDPSNDNWLYFDDDEFGNENNLLKRYQKYNNPEGNFPDNQAGERRGKQRPDKEDLDGNKSLDQNESYYEYVVPITNDGGKIARFEGDYITDEKKIINKNGVEEIWYRFQIPVSEGIAYGGIQGYRSIQFIRTFFTGFVKPKTFRLAQFSFVRNQWRRKVVAQGGDLTYLFKVDDVGLEENQSKLPFNYKSPPGIVRERLFTNYSNVRQDEKSIALKATGIADSTEFSIYKLSQLDIRNFERLQLFVHAEKPLDSQFPAAEKEVSIYIKLGKDFTNNYYEYEVPLVLSDPDAGIADANNIWKNENYINLVLKKLTDLKLERNNSNVPLTELYIKNDEDNEANPDARIKIIGNPSLGYIKGVEIGLRKFDKNKNIVDIEVWVNELRMSGLNESGGVAGLARLDVQLADLGNVTVAGNYSSIGYGALDQKLAGRNMENIYEYDISGNVEIGKFFPSKLNIKLPVFAQYGKSVSSPKYDPYDLDLTVSEKIASVTNQDTIRSIKERALDVVTVKAINITNAQIGGMSGGSKSGGAAPAKQKSPMPWDPSNITVSYAYTNTLANNPILKEDDKTDQRLGLNYAYSRKGDYIKPFKKVNDKLKFIKEIHFNLLPNSFTFSTELRRFENSRLFREPIEPQYLFEDKRFNWDRNYTLQWNLTKDLRLSYNARNQAVIDEIKKYGVLDEYRSPYGMILDSNEGARDTMWNSLKQFGRSQQYQQGVDISYKLPLKFIPFLSFMDITAKYNGSYNWSGAALNQINLGNIIQNQQRRTLDANLNFVDLYEKWKYLAKIESKSTSSRTTPPVRRTKPGEAPDSSDKVAKGQDKKEPKEKVDRKVTLIEKILIRPMLSLRRAKLSYDENLTTIVPGFMNSPELVGLSDNFSSPGWDFVFGWQPDIQKVEGLEIQDNWLTRAADKGWITKDRFLSQQVVQRKQINITATVDVEPFKDFKIKVDFKKRLTNNHTEEFKYIDEGIDPGFQQLALKDVGSFEVSYFAMNTLFNDDHNALFDRFSGYRKIISNRLAVRAGQVPSDLHPDNPNYKKGFGDQSQQVMIPAFMAAYVGIDPREVDLDIQETISDIKFLPRPSWSLDYKGLSQLPLFKDLFSSISIRHGYNSMLNVNSYSSDLRYSYETKYTEVDLNENNYYSRLIIPDLVISENFDPIIGVDIKTKNNIDFRFNYKKSRMLMLGSVSLNETKATEYVAGFSYKISNVVFGKKKAQTKKQDDTKTPGPNDPNKPQPPAQGGRGVQSSAKDLSFGFDFSYRDNITLQNYLDNGRDADPTRGNLTIRFSPTVDYAVTENLILRLFFNYNKTSPHVPTSFPITRYDGGLTVRFMLN